MSEESINTPNGENGEKNTDTSCDFDRVTYRHDLETLLKYAYDEYKHIALERQRTQLTYIGHYFWFAALLIGVGAPLFWRLRNPIEDVLCLSQSPIFLFYLASIASITIALAVLAFGIDSLRGRSGTHLPFGSFMALADIAHKSASEGDDGNPTMLTTLLNSIDNANNAHGSTINTIGLKLRLMSYLLLASLGFGVIALLSRISI